MIDARNVTFAYDGSPSVLDRVSISIPRGIHVALSGPNGSGKTTLALLLKGLLAPSFGSVTVDGFCSSDDNGRFEIMKRVGIVFHNPDNTIVTTSVESELAFGLENIGTPRDVMRRRVERMLERFDIAKYRHANPAHLSGGEKQRLALASVMIMEPSCLILDEPTSLLDPPNQKMLMSILKDIVRSGTTVIHITHFASEALAADRVIVLGSEGISFDGAPENVVPNSTVFKPGWFHFSQRNRVSTAQAQGLPRALVSDPVQSENPETVLPGSAVAVELDNVGYSYDRWMPFEMSALAGVSLRFDRGASTAVLGASGSGKTTLLEIAAGITPPTSGKVRVHGAPVRAMAFQMPEDQLFGHTVESYIAFGPRNLGIHSDDIPRTVSEALHAVGLEPSRFRHRDPFSLSGGEKRRVALAGVLAMNPDMLFLDEPTAGLDREGTEQAAGFLSRYLDRGGTLVFSTHDFEVAARLSNTALVLEDGHIETAGALEDVFHMSPWLLSLK